jgi:putative tryptophan/tyrosine transport system substrate-binding protein
MSWKKFSLRPKVKVRAQLLSIDHAVFSSTGKLMTDLAARYKIPTMYPARGFVAVGGLISYAADKREASRQLGDLVGRVLKGEKPENLPVQQVTKLELVINAKTAKSLGLEIRSTCLASLK